MARTAGRLAALALALAALAAGTPGRAAAQDAGTPTEAQVVEQLRASGLTREQVRSRLQMMGRDPSRADRYFDRDDLYGTAEGDFLDNAERFVFFCRAALEILRSHPVEIVHCHDWQAALATVILKTQSSR